MYVDVYSAFEKVIPHLPSILLDIDQRDQQASFLDILPPFFLTNFYGFETTLDPNKSWVDLAFVFPTINQQTLDLENYLKRKENYLEKKQSVLWDEGFKFLLHAQKVNSLAKN